jgi:hypothetical protein
VNRVRRVLLELWVMVPVAAIVGFLGPFGTYLNGDFFSRTGRWWAMLMGTYLLVRPAIIFWRWVAASTRLPRGSVVFWGLVACSFPMALIWHTLNREETRLLGGYPGILPFTLLCAMMILVVVWWAARADRRLESYYQGPLLRHLAGYPAGTSAPSQAGAPGGAASGSMVASRDRPRLHARLGAQFDGEILALESEDHYVRVHGMRQSELLLLRLRDAIAEMDDVPGEQTHRSWWVARNAVAEVTGNGRNREIRLLNGTIVPVARDSVDRLQHSGFLPAASMG